MSTAVPPSKMHRYLTGMTSVSLARTDTDWGGSYFDVVKATSDTTAYFAINTSCDVEDENWEYCTVKVTGDVSGQTGDNAEARWAAGLDDCTPAASSGDGRYESFESCWSADSVTWPTINPGDDFEITGYCKGADYECAEELRVCFNANDCDDNSYSSKPWTQIGELWDDADHCLYDEDDDDVWECLDDAFDDWLDDNMRRHHDYDDLEDEEDEDRGFTLEDYEDDLDDVGDRPSTRRSETVLERYQRHWASRTPISIYQSMDDVDTHGPSFRLTADEYLTVNFTTFLESTAPCSIPGSAGREASPGCLQKPVVCQRSCLLTTSSITRAKPNNRKFM